MIPNRNIATISQYRGGCIRAYVDIQLPQEIDEKTMLQTFQVIAMGMYDQRRTLSFWPHRKFSGSRM